MSEITTRMAVRRDLPAVLNMAHALAAHHGDTATLKLSDLERDTLGDTPWVTLIVAERATTLLGYAALCPLVQLQFGVRGMDMHHLFVQPDVRGRGVGRHLIEASIIQSKQMGCRYIMVGTHPDNKPAQEIYLAAGFALMDVSGPRFRMKFDAG